MRHIKRTTTDKKKEEQRPRNHPRTKSEKMEIKKPPHLIRPKEVLNGSSINPNKS
jgi:hypothetical protein